MGRSTLCCNYKDGDPFAKDYGAKPKEQKQNEDNQARLQEMNRRLATHTEKVIRIQAATRGFLARKAERQAREMLEPAAPVVSHRRR